MGLPDDSEDVGAAPVTRRTRRPKYEPDGCAFSMILIGGILLPAAAVFVEWQSGQMARHGGIDPVPSSFHAGLIALVSLASLLTMRRLYNRSTRSDGTDVLLGAALGVAISNAIVFLPAIPIGVLAILFMGAGFLVLSPFFALAALALLARLRAEQLRREGTGFAGRLSIGVLVGVGALALADLHVVSEGRAARRAVVPLGEGRAELLTALRAVDDDELRRRLALTIRRPVRFGGPLAHVVRAAGLAPDVACDLFFRATGKPVIASFRAGRCTLVDVRSGDGGGRRAGQLALSESHLAAEVEPDAALSYVEWTLAFANATEGPREARVTIALPPRGVVSRLSLWVEGAPREASFTSRSRATEVYESIVRVRRDPALVTTDGPGRVRLRCFPVPRRGALTVRIGVTAPMAATASEARLVLPRILDSNADLLTADGYHHRFEVPGEPPLDVLDPTAGAEAVEEIVFPRRAVTALRAPSPAHIVDGESFARLVMPEPESEPIVVIVDGSRALRPYAEEVRAAVLAYAERGERLAVVIPRDHGIERIDPIDRESDFELRDALAAARFVGGQDVGSALRHAVGVADELGARRIVRIGGGVEHLLTVPSELRDRHARSRDLPLVVHVPVVPGRDALIESTERQGFACVASASGDLTADLLAAAGRTPPRFFEHRFVGPDERAGFPEDAVIASDHLGRLAAHAEIESLLARGPAADSAARAKAIDWRLVTPVTAAIVLESEAQEREFELKPVELSTVPSLLGGGGSSVTGGPEPRGIWLVLLAGAAFFAVVLLRSRRTT